MLLLGLALGTGAPAAAGDGKGPHLCVASWQGPQPRCDLREQVELQAVGRSEGAARKAVEARLEAWLEAQAAWARAEAEGTAAAALAERLARCPAEAVDAARISCIPQPTLQEETRCWATLPRDPCWEETVEAFDGVGWKASRTAREEICEAVAEAQEDSGVSPVERHRCQARCIATVEVRCPAP